MKHSIASTRYGRLGQSVGKLLGKLWFYYQWLLGRGAYDRLNIEWVLGKPFLVLPTVFNPRTLRSGAYFAAQLEKMLRPGMHVLDMGTGSGVCAVRAVLAAKVMRVVAVDINANAVRCARMNALLNKVEHAIDVRQGDLFAPVLGERFDAILFNPPFYRGAPRDARDCAWRSVDAVDRFAAQLRHHLRPGGFALVLLSSHGDAPDFAAQFERDAVSIAAQRYYLNETLTILRVAPRSMDCG